MGPEEIWQMKVTLLPHTLVPLLNLSSALTLQPLTWHTLFFVFLSAAPFCYFKFFSQFHSYFLHRCGNLPFLFLHTLISLLLVSLFSSSSLFLTSFSSSWTISWCLTITASVSLTHLNLSPPTLWMTFQYCFGVCITSALLWVQISSICAFCDWLFCVFLCIATKAVRKHWDPWITFVFLY